MTAAVNNRTAIYLIERIARLEYDLANEKIERDSNIIGYNLLKDELAEANAEIVRLNEQIGANK